MPRKAKIGVNAYQGSGNWCGSLQVERSKVTVGVCDDYVALVHCYFESVACLFTVETRLVSGELSVCWQRVWSAVNESYPVCPTRLGLLTSLVPLLPIHGTNTADDSGEVVTQSSAIADLCFTCARALIGSHIDDVTDDGYIISTMLAALVITATYVQ